MSNYEHCAECDALTGRAGKHEDSLYHAHEGPFCVECYESWDERVIAERDRLRAILAQPAQQQPVQDTEKALNEWAKDRFNKYGKYKGQVYGNTDWALARAIHADLLASYTHPAPADTRLVEADAARYRYIAALPDIWSVIGDEYCLPSEHEGAKDFGEAIDAALAAAKESK